MEIQHRVHTTPRLKDARAKDNESQFPIPKLPEFSKSNDQVDKKISGVNDEVAQKVSMSGAKARRFLQRPPSKIPKFSTSSTSTKK